MSEAWYDPTPILQAVAGAFDHASDTIVETVGRTQVRKSGQLASHYGIRPVAGSERVWWAAIVNPEPYARAIERGAWVRGRGPHIRRGNSLVRRTAQRMYGAEMKTAIPAGFRARRTTVRAQKVIVR